MCGIAGIYRSDGLRPGDSESLARIIAAISHRGPDHIGQASFDQAAIAHARLSIIDTSNSAHQPMCDSTGRYHLTFNGEIYNFREIRAQLEGKYQFKTRSDSEVLLYSYIEWNAECLSRLNGMYAFALWDTVEKSLFIARDPVGIKPLFYLHDHEKFLFSSEVTGILRFPSLSLTQDIDALDQFFTFNFIPAPKTGFSEIRQLLPGSYMRLSLSEPVIGRSRYKAQSVEVKSAAEIEPEFRAQFLGAVRRQSIADTPIAAFLSSGVDSSAIAEALSNNGTEATCFHLTFNQEAYDETNVAQQTAKLLGLPFVAFHADYSADLLLEVANHLPEPMADVSAIPMYALCRETARHTKVVLSGDGADELLAGYNTYISSIIASTMRIPGARSLLQSLRKILPIQRGENAPYGWNDSIDRFLRYAGDAATASHARWRTIFHADFKEQLYSPNFFNRAKRISSYLEYETAPPALKSVVARLLAIDQQFYLPNDMLVKLDRMSMAHGLEARVPFLDLELLAFCNALPDRYKLRFPNKKKYILRQMLAQGTLGHLTKLPKRGFNFPLETALKGHWKELFLSLLNDSDLQSLSLLNHASLKRAFADFVSYNTNARYQLFGALMYLLWVSKYKPRIEGL